MEMVKLPTFVHLPKVPSTEANLRKIRNPEELGVLIGTKSGIVLGNPFKFQYLSSVHFKGFKDTSALFDPRHVIPIDLPDFDVDFNQLMKCFTSALLSLKVEKNVSEAVVSAFSKIGSECLDLPLFQGCAAFTLDDEYISLAETGIPRLLCYLTLQSVLKHGANDSKKKLDRVSQIILSAFIIYDVENVLPTGIPEMLPKNFSKLITVSAFLGVAMAVAKKFMAIPLVYRNLLPYTIVQLLIDSMPENTDSTDVNLSLPLTFRSESLFKYLKEGNTFDFAELNSDMLPCNDRNFIGSEPEEIYTRTVPNFYPMDFPSKSLADRQRTKNLASGGDNWDINTNTSWCRTVEISHDLLPTAKGIFYERSVERSNTEKQLDWTLSEKETPQVEIVGLEGDLDVYSLAQAVEENRHVTYILSCLVLHSNPIMTMENVMKVVHEALQCRGKSCSSGSNCKVTDLLTSFFIDDHINKSLQVIFVNNVAMLLNFSRRINLGSIMLSNQNVMNFGLVGHQYIEIEEELGNCEDHQSEKQIASKHVGDCEELDN